MFLNDAVSLLAQVTPSPLHKVFLGSQKEETGGTWSWGKVASPRLSYITPRKTTLPPQRTDTKAFLFLAKIAGQANSYQIPAASKEPGVSHAGQGLEHFSRPALSVQSYPEPWSSQRCHISVLPSNTRHCFSQCSIPDKTWFELEASYTPCCMPWPAWAIKAHHSPYLKRRRA